jgi:hypothetical protein
MCIVVSGDESCQAVYAEWPDKLRIIARCHVQV